MNSKQHKGWYSRGYLPHFDHPASLQGVTFHLSDSLPHKVFEALEEMSKLKKEADAELRRLIENYLNAGHGSCYLKDPRIAETVEQTLFHFDGERYRLLAWVIMPNHVHVLLEMFPGYPLADLLHSWKSFTAHEANRLLGRKGKFWQTEYFDRFIRNEEHFNNAVFYIHNNPVKAGLVSRPEEYRFSSASWERRYPGSADPLGPQASRLHSL